MNSKRVYFVMVGLIILLIIALIGGSYGVDALLQKQSKKLVSLKLQSQVLSNEQISLTKAKKDVQTYSGLEQIAKSVVPQDKDQAETVRQIVNIAAANNITLTGITFPSSSLGSGGASPAAKTANTLSQVQAVPGIKGVYDLQIVIAEDASHTSRYTDFINFLSALENNRRTAEVNNIAITPDPTDHSRISFTLTLEDYIKP